MGIRRHSVAALTALLGVPVGCVAFALRPEWRPGFGERLGAHPGAAQGHPDWVHGASVGEIRAALPLLDALAERGPVVASTTTVTGRALIRELRPAVASGLAPLDHPWCVDRALARVAPARLVLVETELWPVWIAACHRQGVPVVLASARISDRSLPRYLRLQRLLGPTLARLSAVGARSEVDAERFAALGVPESRILVTGDLKLDAPGEAAPLAADLARVLDAEPVLVAGSTHPGEDEAALAALALAESKGIPLRLVLAPRRPERMEPVAALVRDAGRRLRLRSALGPEPDPLAPGEVLLLDTLGELASVYAVAQVAFVGGTFAPIGGHNLSEPLHHGVPVVFGPHVANTRASAELLLASGAGIQLAAPEALPEAIVRWLETPPQAAVAAGRDRLARHRGATVRMLALLDDLAPGRGLQPGLRLEGGT